jgi:hypothetical protein
VDSYLDARCKVLGIVRSEVNIWRDPTAAGTYTLRYRGRLATLRVDRFGDDHETATNIEKALESLIEPPPVIVTGKPRERAHIRLAKRRAPVSCRHWFGSAS